MGWKKANKNDIKWIMWADRFYVATRVLYWNKNIDTSMFLGAHAIELYLKPFLIYKYCGQYRSGHKLVLLYKDCRKLDTFFDDNNIAIHFIGQTTAEQNMSQ